ncbi:HAMP domain-containing sensor histidine kinase [Aquimarina sp. 2201CG5-10]|uniref:sensor histidine kinase n=1 Tax=Aquimarina callyspongiae TaxID=3098150 RepID=UPI002AB55DAD|nr:HAMP domain-containing sensor histidine kinase [Aquimarina sp. 2201CG5-10]MDY8135190.1 HAMP domain-containing sensor histidine kinase [Aquimarina sp. 2201CG5-10]
MYLNKRVITAVIVATLLSLVGLIIIQVHWINKSIETNRQVFQQKIDLAANITGELFRKDHKAPMAIHNAIVSSDPDEEKIDQIITQFIDSSFEQCNLPLTYTYGIYKHGSGQNNIYLAGNTDQEIIDLSQCSKKEDRNYGWTRLTCSMGYGEHNSYHLAIFPSFNSYIFSEIKGTLLTSILFILLILFGFFYTIITIRKQKRLSEVKNDFINNLTHEFKTPIFSISLASSALRKSVGTNEPDKILSYVDVIDHEGDRLKNQVDKILELSLLDSKKYTVDKKKIDLISIIKNVIDSFEMLLKQKNGTIQYRSNTKEVEVVGDEIHITNAFYNLVDNAIKYTNRDPIILIDIETSADCISVSFQDNGTGIKKEQQKLIFDKFHRVTKGNIHNVKGFGIGLSYVKEIVEAHRGSITLNSKLGKGSTFIINLPLLS